MYRIFADDVLIYDSTLEDYRIGKGDITKEVGKSGSFVFSVYPDHPFYDSFVALKTVITVYKSGRIVFRGRVLDDKVDYWNNKELTCTGELDFLQDSVVRPYSFQGTPADLFKKYITEHNAQVDDFKKFKVGTVDIQDSNDYINRSSGEYSATLAMMNSALTGSALGGYIYITHGDDGADPIPTIHYVKDLPKVATQTIEFGANLKDYVKTTDAAEIATAIIPLGTQTSNDGGRLTIEDVNDGKDYVYHPAGVALRGWVFKTVVWEDVTLANNLKAKAEAYLENAVNQNITVELNAIDLHLLDRSIESFNVCEYVHVRSAPHKFEATLLCNKQTMSLLKPENDTVVLGYETTSFTGASTQMAASVSTLGKQVSSIKQDATRIEMQVEELGKGVASYEQTVEGFRQTVQSYEGQVSTFEQTVDGFRQDVQGYEGQVSSFEQTVDGFRQDVQGYEGKVSTYEQTVDGFRQDVQGYEGQVSSFEQTVDGFRQDVQGYEGKVSSYEQTVEGFRQDVQGYEGQVSTFEQTVEGITLTVTNGDKSSSISLQVGDGDPQTYPIQFNGGVVFTDDLQDGETIISGDNIKTGTIKANYIKLGGEMDIYEDVDGDDLAGKIGYMNVTVDGSKDYVLGLYSETGVYLAGKGSGYILAEDSLLFSTNGNATYNCSGDRAGHLFYGYILALNDVAIAYQSSDKRMKADIDYSQTDKLLALFDKLAPATFHMTDWKQEDLHAGFIAQDVAAAAEEVGLPGILTAVDCNGYYGLNYGEITALLTAKVQQLDAKIKELTA